jgi:membrane protein
MSGVLSSIVAKVRELIEKLLAVRIVESSIVLAAQAFLALFPLVIVAYALLPPRAASGLLRQMQLRLGIGGESAEAMQKLLADRSALQQSLSVISIIIVIGSATAFTRALQRTYQYAWDLPKLRLTAIWRGLVWLVGIVCYLGAIGSIAHAVNNGAATIALSLVTGLVLWWWTPFLLLGGRVCWRALLPGAILTSVTQTVAALVSVIYVPRAISSNESNYGPIGVVFAIESWLVVISGLLVAGAAIGAAIGQDSGKLGTWIRGSSDPDAWRREVKHRRWRLPHKTSTTPAQPDPE